MNDDISTAIYEYQSAAEAHAEAAKRTATARNEETGALNRMNAAQKQLDELFGALKSKAPSGSEWWRKKNGQGLPE